MRFNKFLVIILMIFQSNSILSQSATITEKVMAIETFFFDEPNPIATLADNPKIYPYFTFKGYEHTAKKKNWKVITLENDYIKLFVLPEIGGKIWGAIEKKTGAEFIYKNEVIKFRNIAMRGPWTSGGIEFNFGIIGHTPTTATPVDYIIKNNNDGSVSCIVGTLDLPSRTSWSVEINLQKDKAYFETKASWYNATSLNQSYYNWMTAAAVATNDLEFFFPGNQFLEHNGVNKPWPIDKQGRKLSFYKNNNFGSHKSYHIVGDYKHFFGGYYHNTNVGFGHWSPYEEMPGQKLWLWALSQSGGIWEDLLTDTDGQYIEFQAGRLFNQYFPNQDSITPITQANFDPYVMDKWSEIWFPYKEINGMVDASKYGVLNVEQQNDSLYIGVNALQVLKENIKVYVNDLEIFNKAITLKPMEVFSTNILLKKTGKLEVLIGDKLKYSTTHKTQLKRPFQSDKNLKISKSNQLYKEGWEALKYREYDKAFQKLTELIVFDPSHQGALVKLAELAYRKTDYTKGLAYINRVLKIDTYNADANYIAGILYRASKDNINALESFGWSARDIKYRSVSYAQIAEIFVLKNNTINAEIYAQKALDYNSYNVNAKQVLLILSRKQDQRKEFNKLAQELLTIDPLNHFVAVETALLNNKSESKITSTIQNEFPAETILEIALKYYNLNLSKEALFVLSLKPEDIKIKLWTAYLLKDTDTLKSNTLLKTILTLSPNFVFPYRIETIPVLEWAQKQQPHWKFDYYSALNYLAIGKKEKGINLLKSCQNLPNSAIFYSLRGKLGDIKDYHSMLLDFQKAIELENNNPILWNEYIQFNLKNENNNLTYITSKKAYKKFPKNSDIALGYGMSLIKVKKYRTCLTILKNIEVLPSEVSNTSRTLYYNASILLANQYIQQQQFTKAVQIIEKSKDWPKNLGVGKPYDVDTRLQDFLLAICYDKLNKKNSKEKFFTTIIEYTDSHLEQSSINQLYGLLSMRKLSQKEKLNSTIKFLSKKEDQKSKLIIAFFNKNKKMMTKLKSEHIVSDEIWGLMINSIDY